MRVGWLGLGAMGAPMAACLVQAGHEVTAFDVAPGRTPEGASAVRLYGRGCPCTRLAAGLGVGGGLGDGDCDHDRLMLERVLRASVTKLARADIPHDFQCGYVATAK